jgi:hypothetical protein
MKPNFRKTSRRARNTFKRIGTIIKKGAGVAQNIVKTVDKFTGGALSSMISRDPRGAMLLGALDAVAD